MRIFSILILTIAAVVGYWYILQRPTWAHFHTQAIAHVDHNIVKHEIKITFLPNTGAHTVHAASLILLNDGNVRAFWFAGSQEGSADVVIQSAVFDTKKGTWSEPIIVIDRATAQKKVWRLIAKLGNPVPARMADGKLALFFVTATIGGWATSSINAITSIDEGVTWGGAQRLITSPFLNLSTLVKSPGILFADGRFGLPIYHELFQTFGELLRFESSAHSIRLIDKRRMSLGGETLQPLIFIDDAEHARAYFRKAKTSSQRMVAVSKTVDAGYTWQMDDHLAIPNPDSAIGGLTLLNGDRILVLNDLTKDRHRLVLAISQLTVDKSTYSPLRIIKILEDDSALPKNQRRRFSYPYLLSDNNGDVHLVYTWSQERIANAKLQSAIKHIWFNAPDLHQMQLKEKRT